MARHRVVLPVPEGAETTNNKPFSISFLFSTAVFTAEHAENAENGKW
jgi:hypothetical protein